MEEIQLADEKTPDLFWFVCYVCNIFRQRNLPKIKVIHNTLLYMALSMPPVGLEHAGDSTGKDADSKQRGAKSGASRPDFSDFDPDLARLIAVWPNLSAAARQAIISHLPEAS